MMDPSTIVFTPLHKRESEADLDDNVIELVEKAQAENKNREVSDAKNREDIADKDYNYEDDSYEEDFLYKKKEKKFVQGSNFDSLDFTDGESLAWKRHKFRRYFTTKGSWFTPSRTKTIIHWCLLITLGISIALVGGIVFILTEYLTEWKLESSYRLMDEGNYAGGFFSFLFFSIFFILVSGFLCWKLPLTAGSGEKLLVTCIVSVSVFASRCTETQIFFNVHVWRELCFFFRFHFQLSLHILQIVFQEFLKLSLY